ncbi:MAG TPA: hypothetical protein HA252_03465 [Candidatus Diapherotrites archaeon]|uniref:Glycerophosphoryl diester phosphodiesterase membrane domain-containing protein n=1 Tax=Candidatus Iainarchaeum sp. TaxID=3101447 RepID=A0A7J4JKJ3_9ARCH|nr:hypothetical protein [Candidatus Diapherotrites archaeon]
MGLIVSLMAGVFELVKRPTAVLPALVAALFQRGLFLLAWEPLFSLLFELGPGAGMPRGSLLELPFLLLVRFPNEISVAVLLAFFSLAAGNWLVFSYSYLFRKEKPLGTLKAMAAALKDFKQILGLTVFLFALGVVFLAFTLVLALALKPLAEIGAILLLAWLVLGYYAYLKLSFTPIAMPFEGVKLREALKRSWRFTRGKIPALLLLGIVLSLVTSLLSNAGSLASDFVEEETASFLALAFFLALGTAYANIVLVKYWLVGREK